MGSNVYREQYLKAKEACVLFAKSLRGFQSYKDQETKAEKDSRENYGQVTVVRKILSNVNHCEIW